jgi:F0F1-type ATP synthase membrane subunit b/b'
MDFVVSLLSGLGVNQTLPIMMGIFIVGFFIARSLGFKTLADNLIEREERTAGREHRIETEKKRFAEIQGDLDQKLRSANAEVSQIFSGIRAEAIAKQNDIIKVAREKSQTEIEKARTEITALLQRELVKIKDQAAEMARMIVIQLTASKPPTSAATRAQREV